MVGEVELSAERAAIEMPLPAGWKRSIASFGLILAAALQAADALIANVALPQLEGDLGGGITLGAWVITSYLCATAVMTPLTGWLRRRYGARRLFPGAVLWFALASLLCAFSPSAGAIVLFRLLQGAGGGVIHPLVQAMLLDLYPRPRHARMMALLGAGIMLGPILGPPIGGLITDLASWRWVFLINLPLGLLSIACVSRLHLAPETGRNARIDVLGIPLLMIGVGALQLLLQRGVGLGWFRSREIVIEALLAAGGFALLGVRSRRTGLAAFRPDVFRDINFAAAAFYNFMLSALLFTTVIFIPSLAQGPLGLPATLAGALIVPRAVLLMLMMLAAGRLFGRVDHRLLLGGGWLLMAGGLGVLSFVPPGQTAAWLIAGSAIQATGAGMLYIPLATLAFSTLDPAVRTDATGVYNLLRQLGYASGVALMSAILQARISAHLDAPAGAATSQAELHAYADCFRMMAVAAIVIVPAIFLFRVAADGGGQADGG